jgi:hypothetical protein
MKKLFTILVATGLVLGLATVAFAGEKAAPTTLEGQLMCGKCTLKMEGVKECQDILVVKAGDKEERYWLVKNEVEKKFGHVCSGAKDVKVTGTVKDKEGKMWIDASAIELVKS